MVSCLKVSGFPKMIGVQFLARSVAARMPPTLGDIKQLKCYGRRGKRGKI